jgi:hypothetical protein
MRRTLIVALLMFASRAYADDQPKNAVSLQLLSVGSGGLAVQAERFALPRHWSVAASLGARAAASGDYDSLSLGGGLETRYYLLKHGMIGPFFAARVDLGWADLTMKMASGSRDLGVTWSIAETLAFGYRFVFFRRVELTPWIGAVAHTDLPVGPLAAQTKGTVSLAVTLGWMF